MLIVGWNPGISSRNDHLCLSFDYDEYSQKAQLEDCLGLCLFGLKMHNRQRRIMHLPFYAFIVKKGRTIRHITPSVHWSVLYKSGSLFSRITSPLLDFTLTSSPKYFIWWPSLYTHPNRLSVATNFLLSSSFKMHGDKWLVLTYNCKYFYLMSLLLR